MALAFDACARKTYLRFSDTETDTDPDASDDVDSGDHAPPLMDCWIVTFCAGADDDDAVDQATVRDAPDPETVTCGVAGAAYGLAGKV